MRVENGRKAARYGQDGQVVEVKTALSCPTAAQIAVRNGPISGIVASPDGSRLLVANYGRHSVSVIDVGAGRVVGTVANVNEPSAIAMGSTGRAYVSTVSPAYDSIAVIDVPTKTVVARHPVALSVSDLAVSPDGRHVYASRNGDAVADVAVLDTVTGRVGVVEVATTPGTTAECVRVSPDGARLYVAVNGPAGGRIVEAGAGKSVSHAVEIGLPVRDVKLSPNGALAYVASCAPEHGAVIDVIDARTHQITATHKIGEVGGILTGLTLSRDGDRGYLVSDESVTVLHMPTLDVVGSVGVAAQPSCVVESPDAQHVYIADYSGVVTMAPVVVVGVENAA